MIQHLNENKCRLTNNFEEICPKHCGCGRERKIIVDLAQIFYKITNITVSNNTDKLMKKNPKYSHAQISLGRLLKNALLQNVPSIIMLNLEQTYINTSTQLKIKSSLNNTFLYDNLKPL